MVKKKILLFGATGMAGHMAYYYLQCTGKYDLVDVVYRTQLTDDSIVVDVTDGDAVSRLVREVDVYKRQDYERQMLILKEYSKMSEKYCTYSNGGKRLGRKKQVLLKVKNKCYRFLIKCFR